VVVAVWPGRRFDQRDGMNLPSRPSIAVLMPAHDEATGIAPVIAAVKASLRQNDRLLVVADNCSDDTADVAARAGAEVVERFDTSRRGKGYALDFGVRHLATRPPEIVVIVDADCLVEGDAFDRLANQCAATGRPAQALYLMHAPARRQHPAAHRRLRVDREEPGACTRFLAPGSAMPVDGNRHGVPVVDDS
jgi:glycosyltransferase involved in cell wall biosynthesis